jgi:hypothetical protein
MNHSAQPRQTARIPDPASDDSMIDTASERGRERARPDFRRWSVEELRVLACQLQVPGAAIKSRQELLEFFEAV